MRSKFSLPLSLAAAPSALIGSVSAEADTGQLMRDLNAAFGEFKSGYNARLGALEASIDGQNARAAHAQLFAGGDAGGHFVQADPEYSKTFASFFRNGSNENELRTANGEGYRAQVNAALSVGDNSNGGYLAPTEWDRQIRRAQLDTNPMRQIANVQITGVNAFTTLWSNDQWGSGWVGETAPRPATGTAGLAEVKFASGEIYAMPSATQRLLDDAELNVENWLAERVDEEFNRQENIAFIAGDGVNKPFGLLQYVPGGAADTAHPGGNLAESPSGEVDDIAPDALVDLTYALPAPYRQNSVWLMNSQTAARIRTLKDGDNNYVWREGLLLNEPPTLLGRPVVLDEAMPAIGAGAYPIAYGDFKSGYLINDRTGTRILRDPYTNKPFVVFYVTRRVGGGVLDPKAIRLMKIGTGA